MRNKSACTSGTGAKENGEGTFETPYTHVQIHRGGTEEKWKANTGEENEEEWNYRKEGRSE